LSKPSSAETWSPEQISRPTSRPTVNPASATRHLPAHLRRQARAAPCIAPCAARRQRRKRYGGRERRGTIPNQVSIDQRPAIVDTRGRFGDWEGDLVIGAGQQQAFVTLNERKSRYALMAHVPFKTAQASRMP
jgi:IS30 family transposase